MDRNLGSRRGEQIDLSPVTNAAATARRSSAGHGCLWLFGAIRRNRPRMTRKPFVLVVDDDADIRNAVVTMLELQGHSTLQAANGLDALGLLESQEPFLIVLDVVMPGMDGRTFLEHKAKTRHVDIPVIVFSSC